MAAGLELLAVLETGQPARLESYLASRTDLLGPDELDAPTRDFVYGGNLLRQVFPEGRSIIEIIAEGDIKIFEAAAPDGTVVTLFFVPGRYLQDARRSDFYLHESMRRYFACRFRKAGGRWQLWLNVCYTLPDGRFPISRNGTDAEQGHLTAWEKGHDGVDFEAPLGTEILATQKGTVHTIASNRQSGNFILVQNDDGSMSGYAHVRARSGLRQGDPVQSSGPIGVSDGSGRLSGPHLHYTYRPGTRTRPATAASPKVDPLTTQLRGVAP
jgi:murein DD-endopeptidase MepM/ murein hydrolase activator NlpD